MNESTAQLIVNGIHDTTPDPDVYVLATFSPVSGYDVIPQPTQAILWDDDRPVLVAIDGPASMPEDGGTATYLLNRVTTIQGPRVVQKQLSLFLNVSFGVTGGTATAGVDYTGSTSGSVPMYPYGMQKTATVLFATPDSLVEDDETVVMSVLPGAAYAAGMAVSTAIIEPPVIKSVTWVETGTPTGGPLDGQPAGTPGGGKRIFAESKTYADAKAGVVSDEVKVRVELTRPVANTQIVIEMIDVDDPSYDEGPVDDGSLDNRSEGAGDQSAQVLTGQNGLPAGVAEWTVRVSHRPGDNYRAVATIQYGLEDTFARGKPFDADRAEAYLIAPNGGYAGVVPSKEAKTVKSELLTVWRHLHVERDHMAAPPVGEPFRGAGVGGGSAGADDVAPGGAVADPNITWMQTIYQKAYVEVADDLASENLTITVPFVHNFGQTDDKLGDANVQLLLDTQDVKRSESFWSLQIVAAYDPHPARDNDDQFPDGGGNAYSDAPNFELLGIAQYKPDGLPPAYDAKSRPVVVFTETVRDYAAEKAAGAGSVGGAAGGVTVASKEVLMGRMVAHESVHTWGIRHGTTDDPQQIGGPNDPDTVGILRFDPNNWGGADASNMLQPSHIVQIRQREYPG